MHILGGLLLSLSSPLPAEPVAACSLPEGWASISAPAPRFVIFGEIHGTAEAPAFVGDVACGLLAQGKRVLLGIEFDATRNAQLQAVWRLSDAEFRKQLPAVGWVGRTDGVASRAMFDLLVRLHALKDEGAGVDIVAFNGARDHAQQVRFEKLAGQGPHEAAQAENIADAARASSHDIVLVLVGNFHARRRPVGEGAEQFEPMAARLAPSGKVISLQFRQAGGTAWNCQLKPGLQLRHGDPIPADAIECADHPIQGDAEINRAPFVQLGAFKNVANTDFDGFFWLGPVHGSPPLAPSLAPAPASPEP